MNPLLRVPLRLIFPCSCLICRTDVPWTSAQEFSGHGLCKVCDKKIQVDSFIDYSADSSLQFVSSAAAFQGPLRDLIHAFKYQGKDWLRSYLGEFMDSSLQIDWKKIDGLVPVPMPFWKEIRRGYNQAHLLAEELSRRHHIPIVAQLLRRTLMTRPQVGLTKRERRTNASRSYLLRRKQTHLSFQRILLIDDVVTTGATLIRCANLLRMAGVKEVAAAVLARDRLDIDESAA